MKKLIQKILLALCLFSVLLPSVLLAESAINNKDKKFGFSNNSFFDNISSQLYKPIGDGDTAFNNTVSKILTILFSLLGVVFIGLLIYGGYLWMMGDKFGDVKKAQKILQDAVIGIILIGAAYAISVFVLSALAENVIKT